MAQLEGHPRVQDGAADPLGVDEGPVGGPLVFDRDGVAQPLDDAVDAGDPVVVQADVGSGRTPDGRDAALQLVPPAAVAP